MFMYGEVYDHDNLNDATHEHLHEVFGVANMRTFQQITRTLRAGHVVAADGADIYLPEVERLRMPISFVHGANNRLFLPEGSKLTFDYLVEHNGPSTTPARSSTVTPTWTSTSARTPPATSTRWSPQNWTGTTDRPRESHDRERSAVRRHHVDG